MDIIKIIGIGIVGTVASMVVKEVKPAAAVGISLATAIVIFTFAVSALSYCIEVIQLICEHVSIESEHIGAVIKMMGIAYLAEFGASVCRDAGEKAIASKIELAGKVIIVTYSIPILVSLLNLLVSIIP